MNKVVNIKEKFRLFDTYWTPKILGEVNNSYVKIFKAKGDFVWHSHRDEDEFFLVVTGLCPFAAQTDKGNGFITPLLNDLRFQSSARFD